MNTSNITKSALALALGLCATGAYALTTTNAFENFNCAADTAVTSLPTANGFGLTWSAGADAADYTYADAATGKLVVDTGSSSVTGTLSNATAFNNKIADHNAKFSAKVTFTPVAASATDPEIDTTNLKFALFAKDNGTSTNLFVVKSGSDTAVDTTIDINRVSNAAEKTVDVVFTANNTFTVAIDGQTSSEYTFYSGSGVNLVEFQGNGEVDDVGFTYELATPTITVTAAEHTSATLNGSAYTAPVTLTEGASYEVIFTADTGYEFTAGTTGTTVSGTVGTTDIAISGPAVVQSGFDEGDTPSIGGGTSHALSADEADYLNDVVAAAIAAGGDKAAVETALAGMTVDEFQQAALLNQNIAAEGFDPDNSYSFDITGVKRINSTTIRVTAKLTRVGALGAINGTATLYTGTTPSAITTKRNALIFEFAAGEDEKYVDVVGISDKFFKVVIE